MGNAASTCDTLQAYLDSVSERYLLAKVFANVNGMNTAAFLDEFYAVCDNWDSGKTETADQRAFRKKYIGRLAMSAELDPVNEAKFPVWFSGFWMEQKSKSLSPVPEMLEVTKKIGGYLLNETKLYKEAEDEAYRKACPGEDVRFGWPDLLWMKIYKPGVGAGKYGMIFVMISSAFTTRGLVRAARYDVGRLFYLYAKPRLSDFKNTYFYKAELPYINEYARARIKQDKRATLTWLSVNPSDGKQDFTTKNLETGFQYIITNRYSGNTLLAAANRSVVDRGLRLATPLKQKLPQIERRRRKRRTGIERRLDFNSFTHKHLDKLFGERELRF